MVKHLTKNVFTLEPGIAFLPTLADLLLSGKLVEDFAIADDPLQLSQALIYVPTRRAARELRAIFAEKSGNVSTILPTIRPLGEFDDDASFFNDANVESLSQLNPVSALDRLLHLAPLVLKWKEQIPDHVAALYGADDLTVPATLSDALWLARDLAHLIDEIETEQVEWDALQNIDTGELAAWWQVTAEFLSIVTTHWPNYLAATNQVNPARFKNRLINQEAQRLINSPPKGPVIAAGATGSIPAIAALLGVIAQLPKGGVVLPGLDHDLDIESWELIGCETGAQSVFAHPQYGLKKLISAMGVKREDVVSLVSSEPHLQARRQLISAALRPAETTHKWAQEKDALAQLVEAGALNNIQMMEAPNERDEAIAIAIALREGIELNKNGQVALVTPDRNLARRVSSELLRFGIQADDSGGRPLVQTPPAMLLLSLIEACFNPGDPLPILAVIKHPLFSMSNHRAHLLGVAQFFELIALRGGTGRPDIAQLPKLLERRLHELDENYRKPQWFTRVSDDMRADLIKFATDLSACVEPLTRLRGQSEIGLNAITMGTIEVFESCGRDEHGLLSELYKGDAGELLASFLRSLLATHSEISFPPPSWLDVFNALIMPENVKSYVGSDQRVAIWGPLEARLQNVDLLILGGLNEGTWPRSAKSDQFLSRVMKAEIDLEPPENRIGQAAHDFELALGTNNVILSRALRSGNEPAVASRWLLRLMTVIGKDQSDFLKKRGEKYISLAKMMDSRETFFPFAPRPAPKPPLENRPKHFSVTEIETLRRDPYAVYARKILRLEPIAPLLRDEGPAERGNLFHDILHQMSETMPDIKSPDAIDQLIEIAKTSFATLQLPEDIRVLWWQRFLKMAPNILQWEGERRDLGIEVLAEIKAEATPIGVSGVTLSGRADRIDIMPDGHGDILDYKTGSSPSRTQARALLSPQLALESALLTRGAFKDIAKTVRPGDLIYVRLGADGSVHSEYITQMSGKKPIHAHDLGEKAWQKLNELVAHFANLEQGYLSRVLPFRESDTHGDYDHLARVLEWSAGGDSGAGEET